MTRSQLLLSLALLCVSGTLAFIVSFRLREDAAHKTPARTSPPSQNSQRIPDQSEPRRLLLSSRDLDPVDPTHYEITVNDIALLQLGSRIERESLQRLEAMTDKYRLTPNQRRQIFPLLVSHHADFTPGLIVNGLPALDSPGDEPLSEKIYPLLDLIQQEDYQQDLLANADWWGDVLGQLRDDLDQAYQNGEVDLVTDTRPGRKNRSRPNRD